MAVKKQKLSEFCRTGSGGTPSRQNLNFYQNGTIAWIKSGELKHRFVGVVEEYITEQAVKNSSAKLILEDALLIAMYGATVGDVSQLTFRATTNQAICHIIPDGKICDINYLYYFLKFSKPFLLQKRVGGGQPNISQQVIKELEVPLPPLPTQIHIAQILDKADDLINQRKLAIAKLNELLQATFIKMFGDPVINDKGWELGTLETLGKIDRGISKHRPRNDPALLGGTHPLIQTGDVAQSQGYIKSYKATYSDLGLAQSKKWKKGTLCITIAANIANTGILTFDACFPDSIVGFTPNEHSNVEFVQGLFMFFGKLLEENAPQSAQKNINLKILKELKIPIPPKEHQTQFAQIAKQIENQKTKLQTQLNELETLFLSLQQRAFGMDF